MSDRNIPSKLRVVAQEILNYARDAGVEANYALVHRRLLGELREALRAPVETSPVHADPTGTTREPPHCPTCACGAPETKATYPRGFSPQEVSECLEAFMKKWLAEKASEPQCICATTAEPLRLVDPQCPKHSTRS